MKRIVQLWFVLALAVGMICVPLQAMDPEEESDKPGVAASATRGSSYQVVQNNVAAGVDAQNIVNPDTLNSADLATGDKPAFAASVTGTGNLPISDKCSGLDPADTSNPELNLANMPQEVIEGIVRALPLKDVENLAQTSDEMFAKVNEARISNLNSAFRSQTKIKTSKDPIRNIEIDLNMTVFNSKYQLSLQRALNNFFKQKPAYQIHR